MVAHSREMMITTAPNVPSDRLLTVVVPAYNVDGYIEEALNSVLSQRWIDAIEIVVIDDGSPDSTYAVAKAMVERHSASHIRLVHQANIGISGARNAGLALVRTPYFTFLDGDDIYLPDFSSVVMPLLAGGEWDMLEYNVTVIDDRSRKLKDIELVPQERAGGHSVDRSTLMHFADRFHTFLWARIYKTALFPQDPFPLGQRYEDAAVLPSVYLRARNVFQIAEPLICYRRRFGSITQQSRARDVYDLQKAGEEALTHCNGGEHDDYWLTLFHHMFYRACHVCARVDRASFDDALSTLHQMTVDHRRALFALRQRSGIKHKPLERFELKLRVDRSIHRLKGQAKKVLRRSLDRHQRARIVPKT
ncbi:glycosyltransferase [Caballeronia sp. LjRoot34]|uniref:glycosyltransferase family 2 protein n=1 Tax=Caballeronia sp. LjRoot34 TaxID=3342325 RepID=UPI003ED007AD